LILSLVEVKDLIDIWLRHSGVSEGKLFRQKLEDAVNDLLGISIASDPA